MRFKITTALCAFAFGVVFADPAATITGVETNSAGVLEISYTLSGGDAIVTCETFVDGVSVGCLFRGDSNRRISPGNRKIYWDPVADNVSVSGTVTAKVTAWPLESPPDYMAVDLTMPNCRRYYTSAEMVPLGVTNYLYKTSVMLFRRIPAKDVVWCMGQNNDKDASSERVNEKMHMVKLTNDFYIGVFEVTQRQFTRLTGFSGYNFSAATHKKATCDFNLLPAENFSYFGLRGDESASFANWPLAGHTVATTSYVYKIRSFTGLSSLDLPTEAQWEYACRAGTSSALNSGKGYSLANYREVGWEKYSCTNEVEGGITQEVGLLKPNNWGLYDMHGNVFEKCLDRYCGGEDYAATFETGWEDGAVTVDPVGPETSASDLMVARGGGWWYGALYGRSASRMRQPTRVTAGRHDGVRFVCNLPVEVE